MCLFLTTLLLGPRAAVLFWWLFDPNRFSSAFDSWFWPFLGIIFLPWTTLMYLIVWSFGSEISGLDWIFIAMGALLDLTMYAGSGYSNRSRAETYYRKPKLLMWPSSDEGPGGFATCGVLTS